MLQSKPTFNIRLKTFKIKTVPFHAFLSSFNDHALSDVEESSFWEIRKIKFCLELNTRDQVGYLSQFPNVNFIFYIKKKINFVVHTEQNSKLLWNAVYLVLYYIFGISLFIHKTFCQRNLYFFCDFFYFYTMQKLNLRVKVFHYLFEKKIFIIIYCLFQSHFK